MLGQTSEATKDLAQDVIGNYLPLGINEKFERGGHGEKMEEGNTETEVDLALKMLGKKYASIF